MKHDVRESYLGAIPQNNNFQEHCRKVLKILNLPLRNSPPHQYDYFIKVTSDYIFERMLSRKESFCQTPLPKYENRLNLPYQDQCREGVPVLDVGIAAWLSANKWMTVLCFDINRARQAQNVGMDRGRDFYSNRYMRDVCAAILEILDEKPSNYFITRHYGDRFKIWLEPSAEVVPSSHEILEQIRGYFEQKPVVALFAEGERITLSLAGIKELKCWDEMLFDQYYDAYDFSHRKRFIEKLRPDLAALLDVTPEQHIEKMLRFVEMIGYDPIDLMFLCDQKCSSKYIKRSPRIFRNIIDFAKELDSSTANNFALVKIALPGFWKYITDHCSHNEISDASHFIFKTLIQTLLDNRPQSEPAFIVLDVIGDTYFAIPANADTDRILKEMREKLSGYYVVGCTLKELKLPLINGVGLVDFSWRKNDISLERLDMLLREIDSIVKKDHRRNLLLWYQSAKLSDLNAWQFLIHYLSPYSPRGRVRLKELQFSSARIERLKSFYKESGDLLTEHYLDYTKNINEHFAELLQQLPSQHLKGDDHEYQ